MIQKVLSLSKIAILKKKDNSLENKIYINLTGDVIAGFFGSNQSIGISSFNFSIIGFFLNVHIKSSLMCKL